MNGLILIQPRIPKAPSTRPSTTVAAAPAGASESPALELEIAPLTPEWEAAKDAFDGALEQTFIACFNLGLSGPSCTRESLAARFINDYLGAAYRVEQLTIQLNILSAQWYALNCLYVMTWEVVWEGWAPTGPARPMDKMEWHLPTNQYTDSSRFGRGVCGCGPAAGFTGRCPGGDIASRFARLDDTGTYIDPSGRSVAFGVRVLADSAGTLRGLRTKPLRTKADSIAPLESLTPKEIDRARGLIAWIQLRCPRAR